MTQEKQTLNHTFQIRTGVNPAFHNGRALRKRIDSLPQGSEWTCTTFRITGDRLDKHGNPRTEDVELWHRDPLDCIQEILENPTFKKAQRYAPHRVYTNNDYTNREYSDMWTADWWWKLQV